MSKQKETKIDFDPNDDYGFKSKVAKNWINRQRVLVAMSRGIMKNEKQLAKNWIKLLGHSKTDSKIEKKEVVEQIKDSCNAKSCENLMYFEQRKDQLYIWLGKFPNGPTVKLNVPEIVSAENFKFLGNCLRHSRSILSFGSDFHNKPEYSLLKNLFVDIFNLPKEHPKSQPFFDKVISFEVINGLIYIRLYQINKAGFKNENVELVEVGPRMTLQVIKVFADFMTGDILYSNPDYNAPTKKRQIREQALKKKISKKQIKKDVKQQKWEKLEHDNIREANDALFE
jgi:ribosome biogenesis protein BRX1